MTKLPLTPLGRIIKKGGAQRVSKDAEEALSEYFEKISEDITILAIENAKKNGRKTIKAEDIEKAYSDLF